MQAPPLKTIVIAGGGTAGWMTAAMMSHVLKSRRIEIKLVESDEVGSIGVGEATLPSIRTFNYLLGLDEFDLMRRTQASIKLGIEFVDWTRKGDRYFHPFGATGSNFEGVSFHQYWLKRRAMGDPTPLSAYSLNAEACRQGRFAWPQGEPPGSPRSLDFAFHFDAALYARYLREFSEKRGVKRTEGKIAEVELDPLNGRIEALKLESGERIAGDFFIDCTGFRALLLSGALGVGFEDWSNWLPVDRAVAVPCESGGEFTPYTRSTAHEAGWQWRIPLQHRTGNGYVYASDYISDDRAVVKLMSHLDGPATADPRLIRFKTGRRSVFWRKNCVAIGLSAGFLEPLESTSIYLIQESIQTLLGLLPVSLDDEIAAAEFNRVTTEDYEHIRDFVFLHYKAQQRDDSPMWIDRCNTPAPDSLERKMELFRSRGMAHFRDMGLFTEPNFLAVFLGQEVFPLAYDPLVDEANLAKISAVMDRIPGAIKQMVAQMPTHRQFIDRHFPASAVGR